MGSVTGNWTSKAIAACAIEAKQSVLTPSLLAERFLNFQESRNFTERNNLKEKGYNSEHPSFIILSPAFNVEPNIIMVWDMPSASCNSPFHLLVQSHWQGNVRSRKGLNSFCINTCTHNSFNYILLNGNIVLTAWLCWLPILSSL